MVGPWITFVSKGGRKVSDIEYLATIESGNGAGNSILVKNTGEALNGGTGDLGTLTAAGGKDLYLVGASVSAKWTSSVNRGEIQVDLLVNGARIESWFSLNSDILSSGSWGSNSNHYHFKSKGFKVDATQIIKLDVITNSAATMDLVGTVFGIEIDDGESPRLP